MTCQWLSESCSRISSSLRSPDCCASCLPRSGRAPPPAGAGALPGLSPLPLQRQAEGAPQRHACCNLMAAGAPSLSYILE